MIEFKLDGTLERSFVDDDGNAQKRVYDVLDMENDFLTEAYVSWLVKQCSDKDAAFSSLRTEAQTALDNARKQIDDLTGRVRVLSEAIERSGCTDKVNEAMSSLLAELTEAAKAQQEHQEQKSEEPEATVEEPKGEGHE